MTTLLDATTTLPTLLDTINTIRETTIASHYNAAVADLQDKIKNNPLQTKFTIYSGCVSEEIAREIASRIQTTNITATVQSTGFFTTTYYLEIEVALPASLIHEVIPPKVEETKELQQTEELQQLQQLQQEEVKELQQEEVKPSTVTVDEPLHTE